MLFDRAQVLAALPQYEVGAQLGRGGFGLVMEGRHRRLGRPVAIKILTISEPDVERRFLAEAQVMAVFDHPHVVQVHDYAESNGLCLIVMEHLPGGTLTARISDELPPERACAIGLAIADALHAAHQRGIVHRDIKPDNVLFAADGAVKVTDFGIAKIFEGSTTTTGTLMGTPAYAAPEQILGQRIGPTTDVYAVGGLLYHLLTGQAPFSLNLSVSAMLHHQLTRRPELPAGMPSRIAEVVGQALEKDPSARPASAKAFALALAAAASADLGPGWFAKADTPLRVDDDIRIAASTVGSSTGGLLSIRSRPIGTGRSTEPARQQLLKTPPPGYLPLQTPLPGQPAPPRPDFGDVPPFVSRPTDASGFTGRAMPSIGSSSGFLSGDWFGVAEPAEARECAPVRSVGRARHRQPDPTDDESSGLSRRWLLIMIAVVVVSAVVSVAVGVALGHAQRRAQTDSQSASNRTSPVALRRSAQPGSRQPTGADQPGFVGEHH